MKPLVISYLVLFPIIAGAEDFKAEIIDEYRKLSETFEQSEKLVAGYKPTQPADVSAPGTDFKKLFEGLPFVAEVKVYPAKGERKRQIVQLADWGRFSDHVRVNQQGRELKGQDKLLHRWLHFARTERVQAQLLAVLNCLIEHHGLKTVYCEGFGEGDNYDELAALLNRREAGARAAFGKLPEYAAEMAKQSKDSNTWLRRSTPQFMRSVVVEAGPVLQLHAKQKLTFGPADDPYHPDTDKADASKPKTKEEFQQEQDQRENRMLARILQHDVAIALLNGSRELGEKVAEADPNCELIVVKLQAYVDVTKARPPAENKE